jgi:hypothetical protein
MEKISDVAIRASVRTVLARNRADTTRVSIGAFRGVVRLHGELRRSSVDQRYSTEAVACIEQAIRRLGGVRRVDWQLTNWHKEPTGEWYLREDTARTLAADPHAAIDLAPD